MAELFNDIDFVHSFLAASATLVERSYRLLEATLDDLRVVHSNCQGAVFVWIDLRHVLPEATWEAEGKLQEKLLDEGRILVSNGEHGGLSIQATLTYQTR